MDIIITGEQGAGKSRAAELILSTFRPPYGKRLAPSDILYADYVDNTEQLVSTLLKSRCRAVLFDGVFTSPNDLLIACEAVKEYREQIDAEVLAVYIDSGVNVVVTNGARCTCSVPDKALSPKEIDELTSKLKEQFCGYPECVEKHERAAKIIPPTFTDENIKELSDALSNAGVSKVVTSKKTFPFCGCAECVEKRKRDAKTASPKTVTMLQHLWFEVIDAGHTDAAYAMLKSLLPAGGCCIPDLSPNSRIVFHEFLTKLLNG